MLASYVSITCWQEPSDVPFDISSVSKETKSQPLAEKKSTGKKSAGPASAVSGSVSTVDASYEKLLSSIPEFADFGKLFKVGIYYFFYGRWTLWTWLNLISCVVTFCPLFQSSAPVELTEAETEYSVNVVKHIFDRHVVLQYNCTNTIPEQLLEQVCNLFRV
jgi:coatomer subunit gamma